MPGARVGLFHMIIFSSFDGCHDEDDDEHDEDDSDNDDDDYCIH